MKHLTLGALRRALDEPAALLGSQRRHLDDCLTCRRRSNALAARAQVADVALGASSGLIPDSLRRDTMAPPLGEGVGSATPAAAAASSQAGRRRVPLAFWSACAAVAIVVLFVATPLRSLAQNFLAIFEPRQFVALPISRADARQMRALPDLAKYGTMRELVRERNAIVPDAQDAALLARIPVRVPAALPLGVPTSIEYRVISRGTSAFTFSAVKAATAAAATGRSLAPMPAGLDGSTIEASVGPAVIALYLTSQERASEVERDRHGARGHGWPKLLIAQMPVPVVASNGVSATTIVDYLAAQPGLPPPVAAELRAIADPTSTLPIPIPIDRVHAQPVVVQNAPGLVVGDNTGVGAGVIWQSRGYVYGVAGTLPVRTILTVANSLR